MSVPISITIVNHCNVRS